MSNAAPSSLRGLKGRRCCNSGLFLISICCWELHVSPALNWDKTVQGKQRSHCKMQRRKLLAEGKRKKGSEAASPESSGCIRSGHGGAPLLLKGFVHRQGMNKAWGVRAGRAGQPGRAESRPLWRAGRGGTEGAALLGKRHKSSYFNSLQTAPCAAAGVD